MVEDKQLDNLVWLDEKYCEEFDVSSYCADFETTTVETDCRVWAWCVCEIGNTNNICYGVSIETFIKWCSVHNGSRIYFHNLKFDGKFILDYILKNGWEWVESSDFACQNKFTTLISDMSQWYSIKMWFSATRCVEFLDSLKIIPLPIAKIPKAFGFDVEKLELDYETNREIGHELTQHEKDYISHDVIIAAMAMETMFNQGMKRITAGSNAFHDYQNMLGGKRRFRDWYPTPDYDFDLRDAGCYKGGFTAVNPRYAGKIINGGCSFDVNSLYPSVMASAHGEVLPFDEPIKYNGKYKHDNDYPLYIQFIEADFKVKDNHIPCLQLKGNNFFSPTEYIKDSCGMQRLCLTSVDLELFFEQYEVYDIRYIRGYKFRGSTELFKSYVDKWTEIKIQASLDGNSGLRTLAKLMLNSLYGKLATNPIKQPRKPYLDDGVVKYELLDKEECEPVYLPAGAFITSYARAFTVRASQNNYERWLYSDTDSCYFIGGEPPIGMEVDPVKLGCWKREHEFQKFKALRAKTYCFEENGELIIHCAGMPTKCHKNVTIDNFEYGSVFEGKLKPKDVSGGIILIDDVFTIRE